jgi:hypothetical protein
MVSRSRRRACGQLGSEPRLPWSSAVRETGLEPARPRGHQDLNPPGYVSPSVTQYQEIPLTSGFTAFGVHRVQPRTSRRVALVSRSVSRQPELLAGRRWPVTRYPGNGATVSQNPRSRMRRWISLARLRNVTPSLAARMSRRLMRS